MQNRKHHKEHFDYVTSLKVKSMMLSMDEMGEVLFQLKLFLKSKEFSDIISKFNSLNKELKFIVKENELKLNKVLNQLSELVYKTEKVCVNFYRA